MTHVRQTRLKLCAVSRCTLSAVPEVVELKVEYRATEIFLSNFDLTGNNQDQQYEPQQDQA